MAGGLAGGSSDYGKALDLQRRLGDRAGIAEASGYALCLHGLAVLELVEGRRGSAARLAGAASGIARSSGVNLADSTSGLWLVCFGQAPNALDHDAIVADPELAPAWAEGEALAMDEVMAGAMRL
ncbi:MAG TPA: hypothetical protein VMP67_01910 [Candidatus Limnocylindria bacterium]|nr:hypothetical protein [Candidatus Limnocylindria bacterium]